LKIIKADILSDFDHTKPTAILHGCNCFCTMGAGIAKYLSMKYPQVLAADLKTKKGDASKLGTFTTAVISPKLHILNCYTQYHYGFKKGGKPPVDYDAIRQCLQKVANDYNLLNIQFRSPKIGCGLAGGNWDIVMPMFEEALGNKDLIIYFK